MQIIWPFKSDYRIAYLSDDYAQVVIGRSARDYVWIMARTPNIAAPDYQHLLSVVVELGYDEGKVRIVPQTFSAKSGN